MDEFQTREEKKAQFIKKIRDPKFFLENFAKIKGKTPGLMPFILNEAQKDMLNAIRGNSRFIFTKSRQIGGSTLVTGYLYHNTITNPGTTTVLVGYNSDLTIELLDKVKTFYRNTPDEIKPKVAYNSKHEITFPAIESKIIVLPSTENVGRGYTIHNCLCVSGDTEVYKSHSETAKVKDLKAGDVIIDGSGVPAPVVWIGSKKQDKPLLRVHVKDCGYITLTVDHHLQVKGGGWLRADELILGDEIFCPKEWIFELTCKIGSKLVVEKIENAPEEGLVFDLKMGGDYPSFLTTVGVIKNCTEVAFWDKTEEKMLSIENAVPQNGKLIAESSPNGLGNWFHRTLMAPDNGYSKRRYGWWWVYSQDEIEMIRRRINDPLRFAQEYEMEFLSTGRPVFPVALIEKLRKHEKVVGDTITDDMGMLHIVTEHLDGLVQYLPPRPGRMYVMGADTAEGVIGGDYSVATIYDRESGEEVAMYRGHLPADVFGVRCDKWGRMYNNALLIVEVNNHGLTSLTALKNLAYPRLYYRQAKFDGISTEFTDKMGWRTTKVTRPLMIDDLNKALRDGTITPHSKELMNEMLTFVFNSNNDMVCMKGYHDDEIFGHAICLQAFKTLWNGNLDQISERETSHIG
jgi:hypothetical protein